MKCEHCGKNEVTFIYRSSVNGNVTEQHLCSECAEKLGYTRSLAAHNRSMMQSFFGGNSLFNDFFSPMPNLMGRSRWLLDAGAAFHGSPAKGGDPGTAEAAE